MLSFKKVLCFSAIVAFVLVVNGLWPDTFGLYKKGNETAHVSQIPEWHIATEPVRDRSDDYVDPITAFLGVKPCDDLTGHLDGVGAVTNQILSMADWSDVSSQDDDRVFSVMRRVGVLNDEREALYRHLDDCLVEGKITPDGHETISTLWIIPAWRDLADASTRLDQAIISRAVTK